MILTTDVMCEVSEIHGDEPATGGFQPRRFCGLYDLPSDLDSRNDGERFRSAHPVSDCS